MLVACISAETFDPTQSKQLQEEVVFTCTLAFSPGSVSSSLSKLKSAGSSTEISRLQMTEKELFLAQSFEVVRGMH